MNNILKKTVPSLRRMIYDAINTEIGNQAIEYSDYNMFDYKIKWRGRWYQVRLTILSNR